jgi:hypothetical protein
MLSRVTPGKEEGCGEKEFYVIRDVMREFPLSLSPIAHVSFISQSKPAPFFV